MASKVSRVEPSVVKWPVIEHTFVMKVLPQANDNYGAAAPEGDAADRPAFYEATTQDLASVGWTIAFGCTVE